MTYTEFNQRLRAHKCLSHYFPAVAQGESEKICPVSVYGNWLAWQFESNVNSLPWICKPLALRTSKHWIWMRLKHTEWGKAELYSRSLEDPRGVAAGAHGWGKNYSNLTSSNPTQTKCIPIKQNLYKVHIFPRCDVEMAAFSIQRLSDIIGPTALPAIWATEKHRLHTLCSRITLICDVKVS